MTPVAVLVGLPGAGKSTTGRRLARILAVPFLDSDDAVEAAAGRSVRDLFAVSGETAFRNEAQPRRGDESIELWCCLTLMYLFVEVARTSGNGQTAKTKVLALEPNFLNYLTQIVARLRWDETAPIPLTKMLLLSWKAILVTLGGIKDVEEVKNKLHGKDDEKDARGQPIITASPLDYHLFRQEISSKYPAYQPPQPIFPLEPENNSILPPLKHRRPSYAQSKGHVFRKQN